MICTIHHMYKQHVESHQKYIRSLFVNVSLFVNLSIKFIARLTLKSNPYSKTVLKNLFLFYFLFIHLSLLLKNKWNLRIYERGRGALISSFFVKIDYT